MRSKEEAHDYRLFPRTRSAAARSQPGLDRGDSARLCLSSRTPAAAASSRSTRLPDYDAAILTQSRALGDYFEATAAAAGNAKAASNWIMGELTRKMNELGIGVEARRDSPRRRLQA